MATKLDKGLLFGGAATGEQVLIDNFINNDTVIVVDGAEFSHGNIDRHTCAGYAVPRIYPTADEYPHWIGSEGFFHPSNEKACQLTLKAYSCR